MQIIDMLHMKTIYLFIIDFPIYLYNKNTSSYWVFSTHV